MTSTTNHSSLCCPLNKFCRTTGCSRSSVGQIKANADYTAVNTFLFYHPMRWLTHDVIELLVDSHVAHSDSCSLSHDGTQFDSRFEGDDSKSCKIRKGRTKGCGIQKAVGTSARSTKAVHMIAQGTIAKVSKTTKVKPLAATAGLMKAPY